MSDRDFVLDRAGFRKFVSYLLTNMELPDDLHDVILAECFPCRTPEVIAILTTCGLECSGRDCLLFATDERNGVEFTAHGWRWTETNVFALGDKLLADGRLTEAARAKQAAGRKAAEALDDTAGLLAQVLQARALQRNAN